MIKWLARNNRPFVFYGIINLWLKVETKYKSASSIINSIIILGVYRKKSCFL